MNVRRLGPGDMDALTELARECDETYLAWAPPGWTVPVAFRAEGPRLAHLGLLFVHPSRWRQGIAGSMLDRAEAEMVARGCVREQLWTPLDAPAERFYAARGWARDGRRKWHPWVGMEMVGYARDLP